jgi:hypothetical protein
MTAKIKILTALVLIAVAAACGGSDHADGGAGEPFVEDIKNLDDERSLPPIPLECFDSQEAFEQCDDDGLLPDECFDVEGFILPECDPTEEQGAESSEVADDDGDIEPAVEPGPEVISSGFDPSVDAFGFENYGGEPGTVNLTTVEMQRMYGDEVCANLADGCTLSPPARQWMEQMNKAMAGGHCEGMAVLSSLFYYGESSPSAFGADATADLEFPGNDALQREIAYWFATQATYPGGAAKVNESPSAIVDTLIETFGRGTNAEEFWAMGIYLPDFSGGHAITPFAVEDRGGGIVDVLVYDNNFPSETRVLTVDRDSDSWQYQASINPDEPSSLYEGDASTKTLEIVAITPRLGVQEGPFEEGDGPVGYAPVVGRNTDSVEVWLDGDANLLITALDGRRIGWLEDGSFINEVKGATSTNLRFGVDVWGIEQEPVYVLPSDVRQFTVTIDGSQLTETGVSEVTMIGAGFNMVVADLVLDPGQQDTIYVDVENDEYLALNYESDYSDSPDIWFGLATDDADYEFIVRGSDIEPGGSFNVALDFPSGDFVLNTTGQTEFGLYDLLVVRIDDQGEYVFSTEDIELLPDDTMFVNFFEWEGDGSPMFLDFDFETNGTIDATLVLEDGGGEYVDFYDE